jgi:hypothetical protein
MVLTGLCTAGKTTAVAMALENRTGVAYVKLSSKSPNIVDSLVNMWKLEKGMGMMDLAKTIDTARQGRDPAVIVIDIATATPADEIRFAGSDLKELVEMSGVIGVLILSNSVAFTICRGIRIETGSTSSTVVNRRKRTLTSTCGKCSWAMTAEPFVADL